MLILEGRQQHLSRPQREGRFCHVDERGTGTRGETPHSSIGSRRQAAATGDLAATTPVVAKAARRQLNNRPIAADATISATRTPPESRTQPRGAPVRGRATLRTAAGAATRLLPADRGAVACGLPAARRCRSEEHTSELQSHVNLVCRLLLEKQKQIQAVHSGPKKKRKKHMIP